MTQNAGRSADTPSGPAGASPCAPAPTVHWLLPIDPAAHAGHLPRDWRSRRDATAVWEAVGLSQDAGRWCLRSGYRTMRVGDRIWAYLSRRQELCAAGTVRAVAEERGAWFVLVDWDRARTAALCRAPLPRADFGQVPMSTCRARAHVARLLDARWDALDRQDRVRAHRVGVTGSEPHRV